MANAKCNAKTALPGYILERNRSALAAGLTIEKQESHDDGRLTTWYRGSEAQWRASIFCRRTKPFNKSVMGDERSFWCFSPDTDARLYVQFRHAEGDYRGSVARERLPKWTQKLRGLAKGIVAYKMENRHGDGEHHVYVGERQALIDSKIAPAEIMHQTYNAKGSEWEWERSILADGRCYFVDYGNSSESAGPDTTTPHRCSDLREFAQVKERVLDVFAQFMTDGLSGRAEQKHHGECTIRYDADTVEQVKDAFGEALEALRAATPRFVGQTAKRMKQLEIARANPEFQSFLHQLTGGPAGQAGSSLT